MPIDVDVSMAPLLKQCESHAVYGARTLVAAMAALGLPMRALTRSLGMKVWQHALHGPNFFYFVVMLKSASRVSKAAY